MKIDTPWDKFAPDEAKAFRVSHRARWGWYWTIIPPGDAALLLYLDVVPVPAPELPRLKNIDVRFGHIDGKSLFYLRLRDQSKRGIFTTLCRDIMEAGEQETTEECALGSTIRRTFRWQNLLQRGSTGILSEQEQKGLIGELEILKQLVEIVGARSALKAWTGPSGAPKDFEFPTGCIEVKAKRGASQPFVSVSNEYQLSSVEGRSLWLAVLNIDKSSTPIGKTLTEYVAETTALLEKMAPSVISNWELHLLEAGYVIDHDYTSQGWIVSTQAFYDVDTKFPRVTTPLPQGVSHVSYRLDLAACEPFKISWECIYSRLSEQVSS